MAKYKKGKDAKYADAVADDDDVFPVARKIAEHTKEKDQEIHSSYFELDGKPFSAINKAMLPIYIEDPLEFFDEFGFRKQDDDHDPNLGDEEETSSAKHLSEPLENSTHKLKLISYLQDVHKEVKDDVLWSHILGPELKTDRFEELLKEGGIPHSMRPFLWPRLSGATKKQKDAKYTYESVLQQCAQDKPSIGVQIERDLLRTLPNNICFWKKNSEGIEALRRILKCVAFIYPDLGYCQGMGVIVATLLLYCSEETTFWMMTALIEDILPPNFYTQTLLGLQADERVSRHLMKCHVPDLNKALEDYEVEVSLLTVSWLLTLFGSVFRTRVMLRVWDFIFYSGGVNIFRVIISILKMKEQEIVEIAETTQSSADIFTALSQLPASVTEVEKVIEYMGSFEFTITDHLIAELRKKHQAVLMADQGMIVNTATDTNLPKQTTQRRKLTRSKSIIKQIFSSKDETANDPKSKNIRQTEILVDLKESVLQICRYFISCDEKMELNVCTQADYSPESHNKDIANYLKGRRVGAKRARALLDFAREEENELGFRKNDIVTIISEKDEHCWVGEVNGLRGWFPAKFVEVVDERGKSYTIYGDEAVSPEITEYIRGRLANSFRQIMDHGIRENALYTSMAYHPWSFIEDIAYYSVEKNFNSVYSRLTLCNTFNLDEDGKILTPEELLFRSVQLINDSHNAVSAHSDVKLRSLLVVGVNEQCIHLWFDLLCSATQHEHIRNKYYHSWAFIRSPAWRQIKCDLRLLSQFSFNLSMSFEIEGIDKKKRKFVNGLLTSQKKKILSTVVSSSQDNKQNGEEPLKQGVTDMLIKHHLFSWDL
ncbi:RUN and TBC1 domain-containing protein 3 [Caenorhabditis elegans]|uniref:RUN and TBC1 domain-containing protein 3 n=1 Tax=Caenorhabditis elegans TaxID=6239 RepID=Q94222_CAEEL|nr:RUN and TBC1 domain-containing protein 3 [Caenorhabditis elegans]CCD69040.1 RUN and TBC1 domain-containing protein 3 [Caenorhabditis elegans]|eukprot:NP_509421.2 TBC (Tre-2/Bub2/Cdc16) domain family [Caenorhabditis elegans]